MARLKVSIVFESGARTGPGKAMLLPLSPHSRPGRGHGRRRCGRACAALATRHRRENLKSPPSESLARLAAMVLVGMAPEGMRITAPALNVLVATIGTVSYMRAGHFDWRTFCPFAVLAIPAAFIGGALHMPPGIYKPAVGVILFAAAAELARSAHKGAVIEAGDCGSTSVPDGPGLMTGAGGGIFLSPGLRLSGWARTRRTSGISAVFFLVNSIAGLAGTTVSLAALPVRAVAALAGGVIGTQLGSRWLPVAVLRHLLAAVLVIAGLKLILT
jgi:uncharacterized protein